MTGRERVLAALRRKPVDAVPYVELEIAPSIAAGLVGHPAPDPFELAQVMGLDCLPPLAAYPDIPAQWGTDTDGHPAYLGGMIHGRDDLSLVRLPAVGEQLDLVRRFVDRHAGRGPATIVRCNLVFDMVVFSMGYDGVSLALYDDPGLVRELARRYTDWTAAFLNGLPATGIDVVWTTDDLAFKTGPFVSPAMFREQLLPFMREAANAIRLPWIFHSDGDVSLLLEDVIALGIDGLHPIEPGAMDIDRVKERVGERVCLVGNVDLHYTLTRGTPAETRAEVRGLLRRFGASPGYIIASANTLAPYCRLDNIRAMIDEIGRHRRGAEEGTA